MFRRITAYGIVLLLPCFLKGEEGKGNEIPLSEEERTDPLRIDVETLSDTDLDALIEGEEIKTARRPAWEKEIRLEGIVGFNDNVLQGAFEREESPFVGGNMELFVWRKPKEGKYDIYLYVLGERLHYTEARDIDNESLAIVQSRISKDLSSRWTFGATLQYTFADQVFDVSTNDLATDTTVLRLNEVEIRPFIKRRFSGNRYAILEVGAQRDFFATAKDDYTEPAAKILLGKQVGRKSKWEAGYEFAQKFYDTREERDAEGFTLPETILKVRSHRLITYWKQIWGADGKWRTITQFNLLFTRDNGSGYYDSKRYTVSQKIAYTGKNWKITGKAKVSFFAYDVQTVGFADTELLNRTLFRGGVRMEKGWGKRLTLFGDYTYEQTDSNRREDEFKQNKVSFGAVWKF